MFDRQKGLYRSPEGAPGGTGATPEPSAAAAAAGASGQPPAAGSGSGDGAAAFDWSKQGLDNDAMALVNDRQWKGIPDVLSSYRNLEKLTGVPPERILKLPGANDPVESWGAVYDRLGRPKAATDYKIPLPEGDTGEFAKVIAPIFHAAGLSQGQVQQIAEKHNAFIAEQTKQATEAAKTAHAAEMTATPNRVGRRLSKEQRCRGSRRGEFRDDKRPGILALKQAMGPSAAMKFLHNIGSKIAVEGSFVAGDKGGGSGFDAMNPQMAIAKIEANRTDRTFVEKFNSKDPVVRGQARAEMERLHQIAYPGAVEGQGRG
jgi:hypothetical protein